MNYFLPAKLISLYLYYSIKYRFITQNIYSTMGELQKKIGDWIELDATSVDPHIKIFGASWAGKQFLVTGLVQTSNSTQIEAIELYV